VAGPMQLVECVADALGVDVSTVTTHDRNLVTAGLRTKGGRGSSAARMMAQDAAHLLIAVAGADQVRASVQAVEHFAGLVVVGKRADTPLPGLRSGHTFGEALTAFVQAFADGMFRSAQSIWVQVEMTRPSLAAKITGVIGDSEIEAVYKPQAAQSADSDLITVTRFTRVTLQQVGEALRS
jgi:hypothetical protein